MSKSKRARRPQRHVWTKPEMRLLRSLYPHVLTEQIATKLGIDVNKVYLKANAMGLRKTAAFLQSMNSWRLNSVFATATRFQPGMTPWNKGTHFVAGGRSAETRFKKGNINHNRRAIGSERLSKDGYLQRKTTETGYPPRDWVGVHVLLWIERHGPVPAGCAIVFKDGDKTHIRIDNLECVTRVELMARNSIHRYPPALRRAIRLTAKLKRTIERASCEKQN